MNSRITFGAELRYAMRVRGLSLAEVARRSGVAVATASSAALGRPAIVTTSLRVARAVAAPPVIPELLDWVERPPSSDVWLRRGAAHHALKVRCSPRVVARLPHRPPTASACTDGAAGQLHIAVA